MKRVDKKGQQMTLGTIIAIVLGIAVLVLLIYGFSTGWGNLWDRVTTFGGGSNNIDTIEKACALACSSQGKSAFCGQTRTVRFGEEASVEEGCTKIEGELKDVTESKRSSCKSTCEKLSGANIIDRIKIAPCPGLCV